MENQIHTLIKKAYTSFNSKDISGAMATFHENIKLQKEVSGIYLQNKTQITEHWNNRWKDINVSDEPINIIERNHITFEVTVHQTVKDVHGIILSEGIIKHIFTIQENLLSRLDIETD